MPELLTAAVSAITEGLKLISLEKATHFNTAWAESDIELKKEEAKYEEADDAKIEGLYRLQKTLIVAAQNELALARNK